MKATELMVGDWVMLTDPINNGEKVQVKEIHGDGYITVDGAITKMFEPIPLTAEILEKNGYVKMSKSPYVMLYMWSTDGVDEFADVAIQVGQDHADKWRWDCLTLMIYLYHGGITLRNIRYVHELQHALRLCNIETLDVELGHSGVTKTSDQEPEPKFNVGDWVVTNDGKVRLVVSVDNDGDGYTLDNGVYFNGSWCDTYHLWTIQDAKDGDVLVTSTGQPFIFSGKYDDIHYGNPIAYCGVNWENKFKIGNGTHWTNKNEVAPATKEQRVLLFAKMKEAGYEWDAEKKELKKMEVASKESEDERIRKDIIAFLLSKNRYMTPNEDWDFHNRWLVWLEKQREKLDPDKVIGWLIANICDFEYYVNLFRKDFEL